VNQDDITMTGAKLFYSYSSADEQLRAELETHLSLMVREAIVETWSFRNIDAGNDWKKTIDANLDTADVILLLISANFIASNYCWDIEMKRAVERHENGEAIVIPVILKACDWHTAPFAKFQALPDSAKPVSSWRPRDRAWENVVAGLRRVIARSGAAQSKPSIAATVPVAVAGSPVSAARRIAQSVEARKGRGARMENEGWDAFDREAANVFGSIVSIVDEIRCDAPSLGIKAGSDADHCVVRAGRVTFSMSRHKASPMSESRLVGRLWFGGIVLPEEKGKMFYPENPKEFKEFSYFFDLGDDGSWCWHSKGSAEPLLSVDLAEKSVTDLLEFHEGVEENRIKFRS
jgi:hypothetical protein